MELQVAGLFGVLSLTASVYAIVRIVRAQCAAPSKIRWSLLVLLVPVIGVVIWMVFGPS